MHIVQTNTHYSELPEQSGCQLLPQSADPSTSDPADSTSTRRYLQHNDTTKQPYKVDDFKNHTILTRQDIRTPQQYPCNSAIIQNALTNPPLGRSQW